jgi:hypothetical protein
MRKGLLALALATVLSAPAFACDMHGNSGIVADNNLWISTDAKSVSTIDEKEFTKIMDRVEAIYAPVIAAKGKKLELIRKWEDGTVNAYAQQTGNVWKVSMFGGLARHETITSDAMALVACHELGHHLGGQPRKKSWFGTTWASNEGQSDWWGNMKCMRKYMENDDNITIAGELTIPELAKSKCDANFSDANEVAVCYRGAMAGLSLGNLFRALRKLPTELKFDTPDSKVVTATNHSHPAPQCRLDTYFAGALCDRDAYADVDDSSHTKNVCNRAIGDVDGLRPLCWYKVN